MASKAPIPDFDFDDDKDDFEIAFELQMEEAAQASLALQFQASTSTSPPPSQPSVPPLPFVVEEDDYDHEYQNAVFVQENYVHDDEVLMVALMLEDMEKNSMERKDSEQSETEMKKQREDLDRRIHDQKLAIDILNISEEEWEKNGDHYEKPYDMSVVASASSSPSSEALVEGDCCRLYFKGLVSEESVRDMDVIVAAIGAAVCDPRDNLLLELTKPLEATDEADVVSSEMAELKSLIEVLDAALTLHLKRVAFYCDDYMLYQYVTGRVAPRRSKTAKLLEEVKLLQSKFTSCTPSYVTRNDMKYAFKFARETIVSQISWSAQTVEDKSVKETCKICYEDTDVDNMFTVDGCLHRYCFSCMKQHVEVKLLSGILVANCPHEGCESQVTADSCEKFLAPELIKVTSQRIKESLIPVADRVYCPYPRCSALMTKIEALDNTKEVAVDAEQSGVRKCLKCSKLFCIKCKIPWHISMSCDGYNTSITNSNTEDAKLKSLATQEKWSQCDVCQNLIELAEGCYHITCRCGHEFCYICKAKWKDKKATCSCPIWDERNIVRDE